MATDEQKRRDLRRMKTIATGLLVVAVLVYAGATRWQHSGGPGWIGYVATAAEAAMVGALADWFAVTALFRHPLGLPIPHTALIQTRKDALGRSLQSFVSSNFLSEEVVASKIAAVGIASRLGSWLRIPTHAARVTAELANLARAAVAVLRDDAVQSVLEQTIVSRIVDRPWGPPAGKLLEEIVADGTHHRLVDLGVDEAYGWLLDNRERVLALVTEQAPAWSPRFVDERIAGRVFSELTRFVREVSNDPQHRVRLALDDFLTGFARDLRNDPYTMDRADQLKKRLLEHPEVRTAMSTVLSTGRKLIVEAIEDPHSELRRRVAEALELLGRRMQEDPTLGSKVNGWIETAATFAVRNYRDEVTSLISETVERWDAAEASRKIELQVGRDLQFIRINGTVVGALAGLLIHTISELVL
ncbi:MAG TPA: DUF445 domain-containing protein [Frankiaceae bacterium]|nr:DUF445 domain-containing protein [Frankiaceae bacterium]